MQRAVVFKSGNMLNRIWNDSLHAGRSLAKARTFTFVCVLSLGIGMAPVLAIPYISRIVTMPPPGLKTEGLVEILTKRVGSRAATGAWSYLDYADLRDANTGIALAGWTYGQSDANEHGARAVVVAARATTVSRAFPDCAQHAWRTATKNDLDS